MYKIPYKLIWDNNIIDKYFININNEFDLYVFRIIIFTMSIIWFDIG